jgi:hypothetical protein
MNLIECTDKLISLGYTEQVQQIFDNRTNSTGYEPYHEQRNFRCLSSFIMCILRWSNTKEGWAYWDKLHQELYDKDL